MMQWSLCGRDMCTRPRDLGLWLVHSVAPVVMLQNTLKNILGKSKDIKTVRLALEKIFTNKSKSVPNTITQQLLCGYVFKPWSRAQTFPLQLLSEKASGCHILVY